ncbi:Eco57I restriction-modification methylase domain-containing protein [Methanoculleus sp.]|uniref:Eco57I restriction-modification methylase domain-containing protein n=1 Tax=Methanoculleus sp. TaxID=90427 RepID=UPI001BD27C78|nr:N-6 DNA methylase [Methanoculleus sp.]
MPAPPEIVDLVKRFDQYYTKYTSPSYNESQARKEFIDPFFEALGWDVNNRSGLDERYKDVIHEDTVRVEASTKAPDYSFRIGGMRKFFVEAKKPAVNLKENPEPAYQVRRYAWSAKLPVSLLTDFEEFIIYDCTAKPSPADKASAKRIGYYRYTDYIEKWDEIAAIFSKHGILTGGYDDYVESLKLKKGGKGTAGIDDAFLAEIEGWRDILAKNIALRNRDLSVRELNAAVQKTIDRIIFLRICEDRGIEEYGQLKRIAAGKDIYEQLKGLFRYADDRYNSGLFHFSTETGREDPDNLTLSLSIDDKVLKQIIGHLYYPDSPYEFSVFPADILGQVYEQFLGKVIRLTAGHQARVEEKEAVRRAGGVFYTPTYIVKYIVQQTVGALVEGKDPKAVAGLHVLDPACGSGSFLLGAYQYLLDWHLAWYMDNLVPLLKDGAKMTDPAVLAFLPAKSAPVKRGRGRKKRGNGDEYFLPVYQMTDTDWRLTTEEKKRILLNNIYGVDIDPQAVEVTKLSLLLKVLEGEKSERIGKQLTITGERVLPSLHNNIKCGNSLIGPDIYNDVQVTLDDEETIFRINAFDWNRAFPTVMQAGGFDAVIGNPPWGALFSLPEQNYLRAKFSSANGRNIDSYAVFIEFGLKMLTNKGQLSYITPDTFLRKDDHLVLRNLVLNNYSIFEMIETGPVFSRVRDTWALVFRVANEKPTEKTAIAHRNISRFVVSAEERLDRFGKGDWDHSSHVHQSLWKNRPSQIFGYLSSVDDQKIIRKIEKWASLGDLSEIFSISRGEEGSKFALRENEGGNFFMVIPNDVGRYNTSTGIQISRDLLTPTKVERYYSHPKIWIIRIQKMRWRQRLVCAFDERPNSAGMKTLQVIVSNTDQRNDLVFLLGLLNSKLMNYYCTNFLADDMNKAYLQKLPIRTINPSNPADVARHDRMVALVEKMLDLNKRLAAAKAPHEREVLAGMIDATDREIDRLVYELYGLTEDEIAVVEGVE